MRDRSVNVPPIAVRLVQGANPAVEQGLRDAFAAAASQEEPRQIAAHAARLLGRGCLVTVEAERLPWSRYRVAVRVQGQPITIATVEIGGQ